MAIVKGKNVIGLNVVTISDGRIIETVDDIAYNPETHTVEALLVSSGGLFSSAKAVSMEDVRNIGEDAVIVQDDTALKSVKEIGDSIRSIADSNKHLVKTNVLTIDGKELGKVTDIFFDSKNGHVESMEVSQGGLKTLSEGKKSIRSEDIVTIGADATVVKAFTEQKLEEQGEEGGLKGTLNDAKEKVHDASEATKEKASELKDKAEMKADEARRTIQDKAEDAREFTEEKAEQAKVKAAEVRNDVREKSDDMNKTIARKSDEFRESARENSAKARVKADELADAAAEKSRQLKATADVKSEEAKVKIDEFANEARKDIKNGTENLKDSYARESRTLHNKGREVVKQTKEKLESNDGTIKRKTEKVVKKVSK